MLEAVNAHLQRQGLSLRAGTIVYATIIQRRPCPGDGAGADRPGGAA